MFTARYDPSLLNIILSLQLVKTRLKNVTLKLRIYCELFCGSVLPRWHNDSFLLLLPFYSRIYSVCCFSRPSASFHDVSVPLSFARPTTCSTSRSLPQSHPLSPFSDVQRCFGVSKREEIYEASYDAPGVVVGRCNLRSSTDYLQENVIP